MIDVYWTHQSKTPRNDGAGTCGYRRKVEASLRNCLLMQPSAVVPSGSQAPVNAEGYVLAYSLVSVLFPEKSTFFIYEISYFSNLPSPIYPSGSSPPR